MSQILDARGLLILLACFPVLGQRPSPVGGDMAKNQRVPVHVPFVGCSSDGQAGPLDKPKRPTVPVLALEDEALEPAYYQSQNGIGVLGPRGWHCFGIYGSGGDTLYVSPQPIHRAKIFSEGSGIPGGPGIEVAYRFAGTSGRFAVAEVIARVFPVYVSFARSVVEESDTGAFAFGPYPKDELVYRSKDLVEYRTPANSEGLGTYSGLTKGSLPIEGAAMLVGDAHDLALLSVRLPAEMNRLSSKVIRQFERDAARCPCN